MAGPRARPFSLAGPEGRGGERKANVIPARFSGEGHRQRKPGPQLSCGEGQGSADTPTPWLLPRASRRAPPPPHLRGASEALRCQIPVMNPTFIPPLLIAHPRPASRLLRTAGLQKWGVAPRRWLHPHPALPRKSWPLIPALSLGKLEQESGTGSTINPFLPVGSYRRPRRVRGPGEPPIQPTELGKR